MEHALFEIKGDLLVRYNGYEEHVVIPEGITAIGIEAFAECESMRSVVIPASVTAIGKGVTNILLYMDEYLHRAFTAIDYAEGDVKAIAWSQYGLLYDMVISLKDGFFDSEYKATYPVLSVHDSIKDKYLFDVLNDDLKEMTEK